MSLRTKAQFLTDLKRKVGRSSATVFGPTTTEGDEALYRLLDDSVIHVCSPRVERHKELESTLTQTLVLDQATYSIDTAATPRRVLAVRSGGARIIDPANTKQRRRLRPYQPESEFFEREGAAPSAQPSHYSLWGGANTITLNPAPSSSYLWTLNVRCWQLPPLFSTLGDGDPLALNEDWDDVVLEGAVWRVWNELGALTRMELSKTTWAGLVSDRTGREELDYDDIDFLNEGLDYEEVMP